METHIDTTVSVALCKTDMERLLEGGEIEENGVKIEYFGPTEVTITQSEGGL